MSPCSGFQQVHQEGTVAFAGSEAWPTLTESRLQTILDQNRLSKVIDLKVGTETEVIASLDSITLEIWQAQCDVLPQWFQKAQRDAAKMIEPKVVYVTLPSATIRDEAELDVWLSKVKQELKERLKGGPVGIG